MKILHIGKFYNPIEGGVESINRFIVNIFKDKSQRVLSFNNEKTSVEEDIDGVPIIRSSTYGVIASQPISIRYYFELRRYIRYFKPDIIHFHYPNPLGAIFLLIAIPSRTKLIVHWHSDIVAQKVLHKLLIPIEKILLKRSDKIIATSPIYRDASSSLAKFKSKVCIIPCSIDENKFKIRGNDDEFINSIKNKYDKKPIVLFIGRHVEYKGIRYLLEAEKFVKSDCVFIIAGAGPLTNQLKQTYKSERVYWVGRLNENEIRCYYHAASVFAFPSITRNEAFGVVLAEAMFCGCPTVTFSIKGSGVNWVSINGETGIEVSNGNAVEFANAIDSIIADKYLQIKMGESGRNRAQQFFTKSNVAKLYQELYYSFEK